MYYKYGILEETEVNFLVAVDRTSRDKKLI